MAEAFAAGCDKVLATNVDGLLLPGCLANLLATFDRHQGNALVEARQFPKEHRKDYDPRTGLTGWVTGCCLLIGRETVEKLGPLDEAMFIYGEDVDYSFRAKRAGIPSVVCDDALFFHRYVASADSRAKLRHALITSRYLAAKWSASQMQRRVEDELVSEGFFASRQDLPDLPAGMQTYPCPVAWIPSFKRTFGPRRWEV
jgi:GT2 family glycosyltransferase